MSASKGLFQKYPNPVFVETGSLYGDGIQQALDEGFKTVYSIELDPLLHIGVVNRFKDSPNVHLLFGDSGVLLKKVLEEINEPITFWLDAHMGNKTSPLLNELQIIGQHKIKTHSIIIDDLFACSIERFGFDVGTLKEKITEINSKYTFILEDGYMSSILVAKI